MEPVKRKRKKEKKKKIWATGRAWSNRRSSPPSDSLKMIPTFEFCRRKPNVQ
jgi:hypothetical protein